MISEQKICYIYFHIYLHHKLKKINFYFAFFVISTFKCIFYYFYILYSGVLRKFYNIYFDFLLKEKKFIFLFLKCVMVLLIILDK